MFALFCFMLTKYVGYFPVARTAAMIAMNRMASPPPLYRAAFAVDIAEIYKGWCDIIVLIRL